MDYEGVLTFLIEGYLSHNEGVSQQHIKEYLFRYQDVPTFLTVGHLLYDKEVQPYPISVIIIL